MTKFCPQCGASINETQRFCNKCGTRLLPTQATDPQAYAVAPPPSGSGQQAPQYAPPPMGGQYQNQYQDPYQQAPLQPGMNTRPNGFALTPNVCAALSYFLVPVVGILFLVLEPYNRDRFVRFHAWQSIFYGAAWFIVTKLALGMLAWIFPGFLLGLLGGVAKLGFFIGWIYLIAQAYQNKVEKLPVIGDLAEQQLDTKF